MDGLFDKLRMTTGMAFWIWNKRDQQSFNLHNPLTSIIDWRKVTFGNFAAPKEQG
jgi:hypothetical protein